MKRLIHGDFRHPSWPVAIELVTAYRGLVPVDLDELLDGVPVVDVIRALAMLAGAALDQSPAGDDMLQALARGVAGRTERARDAGEGDGPWPST